MSIYSKTLLRKGAAKAQPAPPAAQPKTCTGSEEEAILLGALPPKPRKPDPEAWWVKAHRKK